MSKTKIGRRTGGEAPKVRVVAVPAMVELRNAQTRLNHFLWSTEICYGHILARADAEFADATMPVEAAFGHVRSAAWFPNNQGRQKFSDTTGHFLEQTQSNTTELYRLVLVRYYACFEAYLEQRIGDIRVGKNWGPLVRSLSAPVLGAASTPLPLRSVLCADLCRLARNLIVHRPYDPLPISVSDRRVDDWRTKLLEQAKDNHWMANQNDIHDALEQVIGQVANHLKIAREERKELPPEMFYLLFTFTNLDQLACQIEEALLERNARLATWVRRSAEKVRRLDLVVPEDFQFHGE